MERIEFGRTGLSVSPVAFGTWQLSPRFWGEQSKEDAIAAMKAAFEKGINFYDTADAYGDGYAETVLGEALKDLPRDDLVITTKFFNHFNPDGSRYPDLSPGYLMERCEASLKRMGIETIDVCLLHLFDPLTPFADIAGTLEKLRNQGKIRVIGVSNHNVEQFRAQRSFGPYDVIQPAIQPDRPQHRERPSPVLPVRERRGDGLFADAQGTLDRQVHGDGNLRRLPEESSDFQGDRFKALCDAVASLRPMAEGYGLTVYQLILAATLMHPGVHVAICASKTRNRSRKPQALWGKLSRGRTTSPSGKRSCWGKGRRFSTRRECGNRGGGNQLCFSERPSSNDVKAGSIGAETGIKADAIGDRCFAPVRRPGFRGKLPGKWK